MSWTPLAKGGMGQANGVIHGELLPVVRMTFSAYIAVRVQIYKNTLGEGECRGIWGEGTWLGKAEGVENRWSGVLVSGRELG